MRRRGTPVSRETLYEEVWTDAAAADDSVSTRDRRPMILTLLCIVRDNFTT